MVTIVSYGSLESQMGHMRSTRSRDIRFQPSKVASQILIVVSTCIMYTQYALVYKLYDRHLRITLLCLASGQAQRD